mmetsp:Transcript_21800/g.51438  ORF Transcript_21800/g.51438 Transcript_21800/m.51438 type:complete len:104 (-) Transcript_21800:258-569(-)
MVLIVGVLVLVLAAMLSCDRDTLSRNGVVFLPHTKKFLVPQRQTSHSTKSAFAATAVFSIFYYNRKHSNCTVVLKEDQSLYYSTAQRIIFFSMLLFGVVVDDA